MNLRYTQIIKYLVLAIILLIGTGLLLKGCIARLYFNNEIEKIYNQQRIKISTHKLEFTGIKTLRFSNLTIASANNDTIAQFDTLETTLSAMDLIFLKVNPLEVRIAHSNINIHTILKHYNAMSEMGSKTPNKNASTTPNNNIIQKASNLLRRFFGLSTARFKVNDFSISYKDSTYYGALHIPNWQYTGNHFNSTATFTDNTGIYNLTINGTASKKNNSIDFTIEGINGPCKIPFTESLIGISAQMDSASIRLHAKELTSSSITIEVGAKVNSLTLEGKRIAKTPVEINHSSAQILVHLQPHHYYIDTLSVVKLNQIEANVGVYYSTMPDSIISINLRTTENTWQELIESLPKGLFGNLSGMKLGGKFQYGLKINIDPHRIDSLTIEPKMISKGFYIGSYGNTNFAALNDTFTHRVYANGAFVRSIHLGTSNKNYTPLGHIPEYLRWAIATSEDGSFYNHRGFDLDGIRYAAACNIKERRFARGGSTISQQLVKNLYLNRDKNISRKIEEFIIVWIVENAHIVSKDRMLEIYLNIIEWGPNIYGISEASNFYFKKKPCELTLNEALFLAYIIPRPTKFKYLFDNGQLKPFMQDNFEFVATKMQNRGYISPNDYSTVNAGTIQLSGDAAAILSNSTAIVDSLSSTNNEYIEPTE